MFYRFIPSKFFKSTIIELSVSFVAFLIACISSTSAFLHAKCRAVWPLRSIAFTSAPFFIKKSTTTGWHVSTAKCSGVWKRNIFFHYSFLRSHRLYMDDNVYDLTENGKENITRIGYGFSNCMIMIGSLNLLTSIPFSLSYGKNTKERFYCLLQFLSGYYR